MGFRIPAVVVSPYARRGHVDHSIYGFESILKMIRYRYGLPPLTPRDLYANNIAAAFDFVSSPNFTPPDLPQPPEVHRQRRARVTSPVDSGRHRVLDRRPRSASPPRCPALDLAPSAPSRTTSTDLVSSGYLERLRFHYQPATAGDHVPPPVQARDARVTPPGAGSRHVAGWRAALPVPPLASLAAADSFTPISGHR